MSLFKKNTKSKAEIEEGKDARAKIVLYCFCLLVVLLLAFCLVKAIVTPKKTESNDKENTTEEQLVADPYIYTIDILYDEPDEYMYQAQYNLPLTVNIPGTNASIDVVETDYASYGDKYLKTPISDINAIFIYNLFEDELPTKLKSIFDLDSPISVIGSDMGYLNGQRWHEIIYYCDEHYIITFNNMKVYICVEFTDVSLSEISFQLVQKEIWTYQEHEGDFFTDDMVEQLPDTATEDVPSTVEEYVTNGYLQSEKDGIVLKDTYYDSLNFATLFDGTSALFPYLRIDYYPGDAEITSITLNDVTGGVTTVTPQYDYIPGSGGEPGIIFIDVSRMNKDCVYQIFFTCETQLDMATYIASTEEMKDKLREDGYTFVYENHMFDNWPEDEPLPDYIYDGRSDEGETQDIFDEED